MTPAEERCAAIFAELPPGPVSVAEIGVHKGILSELLLSARPDLILHMVDKSWTWAPKACAEAYTRVRRFSGRAITYHCGSPPASEYFGASALDLVFIDADHSEAAVAADIAAWAPKVRRAGVIGGHDYGRAEFTGVTAAVDRAFGDRVRRGPNFCWFVTL